MFLWGDRRGQGEREGVRSFVRGRGSVEAKKVRVYKIVYRYGECLPYRGKLNHCSTWRMNGLNVILSGGEKLKKWAEYIKLYIVMASACPIGGS